MSDVLLAEPETAPVKVDKRSKAYKLEQRRIAAIAAEEEKSIPPIPGCEAVAAAIDAATNPRQVSEPEDPAKKQAEELRRVELGEKLRIASVHDAESVANIGDWIGEVKMQGGGVYVKWLEQYSEGNIKERKAEDYMRLSLERRKNPERFAKYAKAKPYAAMEAFKIKKRPKPAAEKVFLYEVEEGHWIRLTAKEVQQNMFIKAGEKDEQVLEFIKDWEAKQP